MDSQPPTSATTIGKSESVTNRVLETGAGIVQEFKPVKRICAHLNAFHAYYAEPTRWVETNHYCAHLNDDVRQCILYDSAESNARIIGIEYMITPTLFKTLDPDERRLWHSHVFEVKSGMLVMPQPAKSLLPVSAWEAAETKEMEQVVHLYGKVYHLWQTDRGDALPLGTPQLMTSVTEETQLRGHEKALADRNARFRVDQAHKREIRKHIPNVEVHPDADSAWKK